MQSTLLPRILLILCGFFFTACSSPPAARPFQKFRSSESWQALWSPPRGQSIALKLLILRDTYSDHVRLLVEKEGTLLLQMEASPTLVSARGPLGTWKGPPHKAPRALKIWVAFALCQKSAIIGKFYLRGDPNKRWLSLTSHDGKESLQATRTFSKS